MLMARRVEGMLKTPEGQRFELLAPCRLAGMLGEWDPAGVRATLRELTRICRERYASPGNARDWPRQSLAASIARFTLFRAQAGDADAPATKMKNAASVRAVPLSHRLIAGQQAGASPGLPR